MGSERKPKTNLNGAKTVAATGGLAAVAVAVLNASQFLDPALVAELTEKINSGGLTVTSIITATLVWFIAKNRRDVQKLQDKLEELTADADDPPQADPTDDDDSA